MYKDRIKVNSNFDVAINISMDLGDDRKIDEYISLPYSKTVIKEILNNKEPTNLIAPYGKGKSHLLLVMLGLLEGNAKAIEKIDDEGIINRIKNHRYLPVIINSDFEDINRAFIKALVDAFERIDLSTDFIVSNKNDVAAFLKESDITKKYSEALYQLNRYTDYDRIIVIFDEFSKYLETQPNTIELYKLQVLFEFFARVSDLKMVLVTHKSTTAYLRNDRFKALEGRIHDLHFEPTMEQNFELMSRVIKLNSSKMDKKSKKILELAVSEKYVPEDLPEKVFPLNPVSADILVKISDLIGQNQRSLFNFLSGKSRYGFREFISSHDTGLLNTDSIYEYFLNELKATNDSRIKDIFLETESKITENLRVLQKRLLRSFALLKMVNHQEITRVLLAISIGKLESEIEKDFNELINNNVLRRLPLSNTYDFSNKIVAAINVEIESKLDSVHLDITKAIQKHFSLGWIIPRRYNDRFQMTRFFKVIAAEEETFLKLNNLNNLYNERYSDGLVIFVIGAKKTEEEIIGNNKIIPIKELPDKETLDLLKKSEVISSLAINDENRSVIQNIKSEIDLKLNSNLKNYFQLDSSLSNQISEVCEFYYGDTPKINYELINVQKPTTQMWKSIDLVINELWGGAKNSGSSEKNILSVIMASDISKIESRFNNYLEGNTSGNFSDLFGFVFLPPFGIRYGVSTLILARLLADKKNEFIISYRGNEVSATPSELRKIVSDLSSYSYNYMKDTKEKREYLEQLSDIFGSKPNIESIVISMQEWVFNLPKLTRSITTARISNYVVVKNVLLKENLNKHKFIMEDLINYLSDIDGIKSFKQYFDRYMEYAEEKIETIVMTANLDKLAFSDDIAYSLEVKELRKLIQTQKISPKKVYQIIMDYPLSRSDVTSLNSFESRLANVIREIESAKAVEYVEISSMGNLLKNNLEEIIEEYGEALAPMEKVAILNSIIKDYIS